MEENKTKKKKLTLSISTKKSHSVSNYLQTKQKTSVVIEKKPQRKWSEKKFQPRENNFNKPKTSGGFVGKKPTTGRNFDIRKMAEERATKRFKVSKDDILLQKKGGLGKEKGFAAKRENYHVGIIM